MKLDATDEKILAILKKDSRKSNVAIAKQVGLTEGAVRMRLRRLEKDGVIAAYTIKVSKAGAQYAVIMVKSKAETKKMMKDIERLKIHTDAYEISGAYDGCVIVHGATIDEIDKKIDRIRELRSVADTTTFIALRRW
jgi:Lrp/AsnC family transcriptional regulator of lysine biosynthesis